MTDRQTGTLAHDWYTGTIPENTFVHPESYVATSYSFLLYRSQRSVGLRIGRGSAMYAGMFDVGPEGEVTIGEFSCLTAPFIIADSAVHVGDLCLIGYNVVLMDCDPCARDQADRRAQLTEAARSPDRRLVRRGPGRPIVIGDHAWVSFDVVVMPGVQIGTGAVVRARSVVTRDVPPYTLVSGNPAVEVRALTHPDRERVAAARRNAEAELLAAPRRSPG